MLVSRSHCGTQLGRDQTRGSGHIDDLMPRDCAQNDIAPLCKTTLEKAEVSFLHHRQPRARRTMRLQTLTTCSRWPCERAEDPSRILVEIHF